MLIGRSAGAQVAPPKQSEVVWIQLRLAFSVKDCLGVGGSLSELHFHTVHPVYWLPLLPTLEVRYTLQPPTVQITDFFIIVVCKFQPERGGGIPLPRACVFLLFVLEWSKAVSRLFQHHPCIIICFQYF